MRAQVSNVFLARVRRARCELSAESAFPFHRCWLSLEFHVRSLSVGVHALIMHRSGYLSRGKNLGLRRYDPHTPAPVGFAYEARACDAASL